MSQSGTTWALIPVKDFEHAKSRLGSTLGNAERRALARSLFEGVLQATRDCDSLGGTLVATDSAGIAAEARRLGLSTVLDGSADGLGQVVDQALDHLRERGADAALVLMGDLPRLSGADLQALLERMRESDAVIAPDRRRAGTNALGLRLQPRWSTCFGHQDSFGRHLGRVRALGLNASALERDGLGFDVDTPEDLAEL